MIKNRQIVFFGTPEFAVPALRALHQNFNVVLAVTQPDKPVGRKQKLSPTAVKIEAQKLGLKVVESLNDLRSMIDELIPDVGVVAAYGKIISQAILDLFPFGCLNIHPSLLPKYRGASPIQSAILNGDAETGVSIIKLDNKMDHGPIISNSKFQIPNFDTYEGLSKKLAKTGADLLIKTLPDYLGGKIKLVAQNDNQATFTKIIKREDGKINWQKPAVEIERQIRAYFPWPGSFTEFSGKRLKIITAEVTSEAKEGKIGEFLAQNGQLLVKCGKDALNIKELQIEGKNELTAKEFINGFLK